MRNILLISLTLLLGSQAFMPMSAPRMSTRLAIISPDETEAMFKQAHECVEGECSVDEVGDLIMELKSQQRELNKRLDEVKKMINTLEHLNEKDERKVDEVRETVRAIFRIFQLGDKASGNDYPALTRATGWSGDIGDGPKTAYDSLPPKKWKSSS